MTAQVTIEGLEELQKKAEQMVRDMSGNPMVAAMRRATLLVTESAKRRPRMPVDTGRLRASITPEVITGPNIVQGIVGSNVFYAPFQELGTLDYAGAETSTVSEGAGVKGEVKLRGIRPRRFLLGAIEDNAQKIAELLSRAVDKIAGK